MPWGAQSPRRNSTNLERSSVVPTDMTISLWITSPPDVIDAPLLALGACGPGGREGKVVWGLNVWSRGKWKKGGPSGPSKRMAEV